MVYQDPSDDLRAERQEVHARAAAMKTKLR